MKDEIGVQADPSALEEILTLLAQMADAFFQPGPAAPAAPLRTLPPGEDGILLAAADGRVLSGNESATTMWGYGPGDMVGRAVADFVDPVTGVGRTRRGQVLAPLEVIRLPLPDASWLTMYIARRRSYAELLEAENRFRVLIEQLPAVTFTAALGEGLLNDVYISPQVEGLLGYTPEEWLSDPVLWYWRLHPDDRDMWNREFARGCATGGPFRAECRFLAKDGHTVWVHGEARIIRDASGLPRYMQGVAFDITDGKVAEQSVRAALKEKEVLLKEIHHRVKNNLQITSSLLRLAGQKQDPQARAHLRESQNRIRSMALVHEKLYQSENLAELDFGAYVRSLVASLVRSFGEASRRVRIETDVGDVSLGIDTAVPCGLIINELISNAIKHAFPDGANGTVRLSMRAVGETRYELLVSDDGVGFPPDFEKRKALSLGMELVTALTGQLGAELDMHSNGGVQVRITLPRKPPSPAIEPAR